MKERLQKYLARSGVASRRRCEALIRAGRVCINGQPVTEPGIQVDSQQDVVTVGGRRVQPRTECTYLMLHKPAGYVTTRRDELKRPTVMQLLPPQYRHLHYAGRLDYDSSGLLLLTDDGELTFRLTHPRHGIEKTYRVEVEGRPSREAVSLLVRGVLLPDGTTAPARVRVLGQPGRMHPTRMELRIREGRNRQVRRMLEAVGHPVLTLQRVRLGNLELGDLPEGRYRLLTKEEKEGLLRIARGHNKSG